MAGNFYFKDRSGAQNGPVTSDELVALARAGRIAPDCLVWAEGGEPAPAGQFPDLAEVFGGAPGPSASPGQGPMIGDFSGWGLIWRGFVFGCGVALIVTAPWAGRWFYGWIASRLSLANGAKLRLESTLQSCGHLFVIWGVAAIGPAAYRIWNVATFGPAPFRPDPGHVLVNLVGNVCIVVVSYMIVRWFARSLRSADNSLDIEFTGGFWAYFGWDILMVLSIFTVIGWAWVIKGKMRWMCQRTVGSHSFEFIASGWQILWRFCATILAVLLPTGLLYGVAARMFTHGDKGLGILFTLLGMAAFFYMIAWTVRWIYNWLISQVVVAPGAAPAAFQRAA